MSCSDVGCEVCSPSDVTGGQFGQFMAATVTEAFAVPSQIEARALTGLGLGVFVSLNRSVVAHYDDINPYF